MQMSPEERRRQMEEASRRADDAAAELLHTELKALHDHMARLNEIRPETADPETYDKLIAEVQAATANNESLAALGTRIKALGEGAVSLAKQLATAAGSLA